MIIGPKYKIARKLGAPVFEKTQTQKYAQHVERRSRTKKGFSKPKSEYAFQHNEKQKARMVYCVSEKQFSKYVRTALEKKASRAVPTIYESLELRLDNAVARIGFSTTRLAARQMVSHGHITVNGTKVTIPSYKLSLGDVIGIRKGSLEKPLFASFDERFKSITLPAWLVFNPETKTATVQGMPKMEQGSTLFDLGAVVEFYSR
ncbi:MAG: 30S ribosomal protein S4 [Minisyncoccota bacterium]